MNGLDLLVQIEVALVLFHLPLDATANFLINIEDVDFTLKLFIEVLEAFLDLGKIQDHLLGVQLERQVRGDRIG